MPVVPHPLNNPHLDKLAGLGGSDDLAPAEEIERRVQNVMNEWQKFYFKGVPFSTPGIGGVAESKTFDLCEILWGRATPKEPSVMPLLHTQLTDRRDGEKIRVAGGMFKMQGDWTWNTFVRAHQQTPADPNGPQPVRNSAAVSAARDVRRLADQYAWLLRSVHTTELALKGISKVRVLSGPRDVQSGAMHLYQIIYTARVSWRIPGNPP